ncbi:hypothetical protein [Staphylococcus intermedius]|uniref:Phage protein n=1 Tax=Staphylococcus intermedius NCTC 11048 TaxID=1141106 RepID=A0A380G9Y0_STAIN|nr:hypothetical protein [Staphylococcus intermedius]SUM47103.1 Uncharacterised protein [Staphylococcus intermedius NCTC 11048]
MKVKSMPKNEGLLFVAATIEEAELFENKEFKNSFVNNLNKAMESKIKNK